MAAPNAIIQKIPANTPAIELQSSEIRVDAGKAQVIKLSNNVTRVAVGDPKILDYILISSRQLYVIGKSIGTTNMILWYGNGESATLNVDVSYDLEHLRKIVARDLPQEKDIKIDASSGAIVLSGSVSNTLVAGSLVNMTEAYLRNVGRSTNNVTSIGAPGQAGSPASGGPQSSSSFTGRGGDFSVNILNLIKIRDPQQVMLEVKIASVDKRLLDQIGVKGSSANTGSFNYSVLSSAGGPVSLDKGVSLSGSLSSGTAFPLNNASSSFLNILLGDRSGLTKLGISAEKAENMVRVLAEPNIVTISGQEGRFLKGGKIFIPVPQVGGAGTTLTLEEKEFGVGVRFIPTVLDGGRINLKVAPEVSSLSQTGIAAGGGSTVFPSFETKSVSTTVQLNNGEVLVIGGLLDDETIAGLNGVPGLSTIPFFGALFRTTSLSKVKTELVIVVKASLVSASMTPPVLPTDITQSPSNADILIGGKLEGLPKVEDTKTLNTKDMNTSELGTNGQSQSMTESNAVINKPTNLIDLLKSKFKGNSQ
jgi:pilus assembly protein CpaC